MNTRAISIIFELAPGKFVLYFNALIKLAMFQQNNYLQSVKNSHHLTRRNKQREISGANMISWLLMLIMVSGPFQASVAMDSNLNTQDREKTLTVQFQEPAAGREGNHCIAESPYCQPLSTCVAHFNCTPISLTSPPQISLQARFYHHHLVADVAVSTRFPDPLKRPPRS